MRTNIVIDDELLQTAMRAAGTKTKRETVESGLRALIAEADPSPYEVLWRLAGHVEFDTDPDDALPRWGHSEDAEYDDGATVAGDWW
jgi:Arc/MetJ family transcription regulator